MNSNRNGLCCGRQVSPAKPRRVPFLCPCVLASRRVGGGARTGIEKGPLLTWKVGRNQVGESLCLFCFNQNSNMCLFVRPLCKFLFRKSFMAKFKNNPWTQYQACFSSAGQLSLLLCKVLEGFIGRKRDLELFGGNCSGTMR